VDASRRALIFVVVVVVVGFINFFTDRTDWFDNMSFCRFNDMKIFFIKGDNESAPVNMLLVQFSPFIGVFSLSLI